MSESGIRPIADWVEAIRRFPQPKTVAQLQTYLGMVNLYRRFLPAAARVLRPLTDALQGGPKGLLDFSKEMEEALKQSKPYTMQQNKHIQTQKWRYLLQWTPLRPTYGRSFSRRHVGED